MCHTALYSTRPLGSLSVGPVPERWLGCHARKMLMTITGWHNTLTSFSQPPRVSHWNAFWVLHMLNKECDAATPACVH